MLLSKSTVWHTLTNNGYLVEKALLLLKRIFILFYLDKFATAMFSRIDIAFAKCYNFSILSNFWCKMANSQNYSMLFLAEFNAVLMNHEMPPLEKIDKLLQLQKRFDELPNEASKNLFRFQSNVELCKCYVQTNQRYELTPIVAEIKDLLIKMEQHDFATQPKDAHHYIAERLQSYYDDLIAICQAKNHQLDVAYCYQQISRIWAKVDDQTNSAKAFVNFNLALSFVPDKFSLSREQLLNEFPDLEQFINSQFDKPVIKTDPVEQTKEYLEIYDQAERIIYGMLTDNNKNNQKFYWKAKKLVLVFHFGIEWKSPLDLNPDLKV